MNLIVKSFFGTQSDDPRSTIGSSTTTTMADYKVPSQKECHDIFTKIDYNGNNILSLAELDRAVIETWPAFDNKPAIMRAYKAADKNGDGFIKKNEFRFFLKYIHYYNKLWSQFADMDADGDRRLTKQEFVKAAGAVDEMSEADLGAVFDEMDANEGGKVLFDEFCAYMAAREE
jgi:Ca2+-binding EF-hand superfamily protein